MRVLIMAGGTRGDIQPMLALALGLRARGHQPLFCGPPNFAGWVRGLGLPFTAVGQDPRELLLRFGRSIHRAVAALRDEIRSEFEALTPLASEVDVILGASVTSAGGALAEARGLPYAYFMFSPSLLASGFHPCPTCPPQRLPRLLNRLTWAAHRWLWNRLFRRAVDEQRARLGLPGIRDVWGYIQGQRIVVASAPALAGLPEDVDGMVGPGVTQVGPMLLGDPTPLPPALLRFLEAGPPPIYVGFGSMIDREAARSTAILVQAIRAAGVRAVISQGWAGLGDVDGVGALDPALVQVVGPVAHQALFPRVAAVVHHGGAGTTTAAARAGVPQLIVPHLLDQHFWAHRVSTLGLGPRPIPRGRLTARRLAAGLRACLDDGPVARARALAPRIAADGVERAVALIETLGTPPVGRVAVVVGPPGPTVRAG